MIPSGTNADDTMPWGNAFVQTNIAPPDESFRNLLGMIEIESPKLQTKTLRQAPDLATYKLYRAAQEWDLIDPILIRDRKDLKSEPKWREHIKPFEIWSVIDNSSLSAERRDQFFKNPSEFSKQPGRFSFIGELHNMAKDTAYDYFKDRPKTKRSRQR